MRTAPPPSATLEIRVPLSVKSAVAPAGRTGTGVKLKLVTVPKVPDVAVCCVPPMVTVNFKAENSPGLLICNCIACSDSGVEELLVTLSAPAAMFCPATPWLVTGTEVACAPGVGVGGGVAVGITVAVVVGIAVAVAVGTTEGLDVGAAVGVAVGAAVGVAVGVAPVTTCEK